MTFPEWIGGLMVSVLGIGFGAWLAFAVERWQRSTEAKQREKVALTMLMDDLAMRRALHHKDRPTADLDVREDDSDYARCNKSVLAVREAITHAKRELRPGSTNLGVLRRMTGECNEYLESSSVNPREYPVLLATLSDKLHQRLNELSGLDGEEILRPGSQAYGERDPSSPPAQLPTATRDDGLG